MDQQTSGTDPTNSNQNIQNPQPSKQTPKDQPSQPKILKPATSQRQRLPLIAISSLKKINSSQIISGDVRREQLKQIYKDQIQLKNSQANFGSLRANSKHANLGISGKQNSAILGTFGGTASNKLVIKGLTRNKAED